jgi:hypothetical protein
LAQKRILMPRSIPHRRDRYTPEGRRRAAERQLRQAAPHERQTAASRPPAPLVVDCRGRDAREPCRLRQAETCHGEESGPGAVRL